MKAVAAGLVLIVGAAIILWYGNTLNSWVLGGLIGGLAALLLSIPISLTLFSYFASRQEEQSKQEEVLNEMYEQPMLSPRVVRKVYEVEGSIQSSPAKGWGGEDKEYSSRRNLPVPSSYPRLPVTNRPPAANRLPVPQRGTSFPSKQLNNVSEVKGKSAAGRRKMSYPGFPGYEPGFSQHRTAALRAARMESTQRKDDVEVLPTSLAKRLPPVRDMGPQKQPPIVQRSSRPLTNTNMYPRRPRRAVVDADSSQHESRHSSSAENERIATWHGHHRDPQTDHLDEHFSQTGSIHQQKPEVTTENLQRPFVRKAPYRYDDDLLR